MEFIKIPRSNLLTNKFGSFYLWTEKPYSKYCGLFFKLKDKLYKCIEAISAESELVKNEDSIVGISNARKEFTEYIYLSDESNAAAFKFSDAVNVRLTLDVREANDLSDWGREYAYNVEQDCILIKYIKRGSSDESENYTIYLAIKSSSDIFDMINQFRAASYDYDRLRHSSAERYVYDSIRFYSSFFTISMSFEKERAIEKACELYKSYTKEISNDKRYDLSTGLIIHEDELRTSYKQANVMMQKLICTDGILAGIPWFFHYWCRDELICLDYLLRRKKLQEAKVLITKYLKLPSFDGRLYAIYPDKGNMSADGAGWLVMRYAELYRASKSVRGFGSLFKDSEHKDNIESLEKIMFGLLKYYVRGGLTYSGKDETWMDTSVTADERVGYCIEIQCLTLRMLKDMYFLTGNSKYSDDESNIRQSVREKFLSGGVLYDALSTEHTPSKSIRPNIFIAYYVYPELLEKEEWEKAFDHALDALWLEWGGLSSLDKNSRDFIDSYSGENNISYHRGDSWFYLNCMAAICMLKLNKKKYDDNIMKIANACSEVCRHQGIIGSIPEVSSAKELTCYGCLAQAWSLALFTELIEEMYK